MSLRNQANAHVVLRATGLLTTTFEAPVCLGRENSITTNESTSVRNVGNGARAFQVQKENSCGTDTAGSLAI